MNTDHAACRTWAHWWKPYDARKDGRTWIADLRCGRCGSHRLDHIDARGGGDQTSVPHGLGVRAQGRGTNVAGHARLDPTHVVDGGHGMTINESIRHIGEAAERLGVAITDLIDVPAKLTHPVMWCKDHGKLESAPGCLLNRGRRGL